MAIERKKVEKKPVVAIEPKKRERPIEVKPEVKVVEPAKVKAKVEKKVEVKVVEPVKAKVAPKPVPKVEPKKRVEPKPVVKVPVKPEIKKITEEEPVNSELVMESKRVRAKPSDDKYIRFASSQYKDNFKVISERVQKNEIKFAYFAIDGDDFYHYYILTKN